MAQDLRQGFVSIPEANVSITKEYIDGIDRFCRFFETKGNNGLALNSPFLGVVGIKFTQIDRDLFFSVINIPEDAIKAVVREVEVIDDSWVVLNDPFNQVTIWLVHRILNSNLNKVDIERGTLALFKLMHYRFFTSIVSNSFKHGADQGTMEKVINGLSNKFDIVQYKTWKGAIEAQCVDLLDPKSIHFDTLQSYNDDKKINYVITDTQTRLRSKIRLIAELYYRAKEEGEAIGSYGHVDTIDGEKVISSSSNVMDVMITSMLVDCQNVNRLIDNELIYAICKKSPHVQEDALKRILTIFADLGKLQMESGEFYAKKKPRGEEEYYIGVGLIVTELLQKTYRLCYLDRVNMNSKFEILQKVSNIYTSSRIANEDVWVIKRSIYNFVLSCGESKRDATNASITIAIILYLMIRSFNYL
jgi:hypothetical protein